MCINHIDFEGDSMPYSETDPKIGESYDVISITVGFGKNCDNPVPCYDLAGFTRYVYDQRNFAVISDLDETNLVNHKPELETA